MQRLIRFAKGGGTSKKQKLEEKQLELELRKTALAEKEAENRSREIGLKEKRLGILNKAISSHASTDIVAALGEEDNFELGESAEKVSS